jgi:hypothetical protein
MKTLIFSLLLASFAISDALSYKLNISKQKLYLNSYKSNKLISKKLIDIDSDYYEDISNVEVYTLDINSDNKLDILLKHSYMMGIGPMAGMESVEYQALINQKDKYIKYKKNSEVTKIINTTSISEIKDLYISSYKNIAPSIGIKVSKDREEYLIKDNENIIISFKIKNSKKRLTIAIDKKQEYLVYRYGNKNKIEMTFKQLNSKKGNQFLYRQENSFGYVRDEIKSLSFEVSKNKYEVYDNYIESENNQKNGLGIKVTTNSGKVIYIEGDESSKSGNIELIKSIDWIKKSIDAI